MPGKMVEWKSDGTTAQGYLAVPAARGPALIVIQEWWGLVAHIKAVADRFAAAGFTALAPDLYRGKATSSPDEAGRLMMALDIARAGRDLAGAVDYLLAQPSVSTKTVGALGFCMGGQLALAAGCTSPKVGAVIDFYGVHPAVKLDFARLSAPVLGLFGERDAFVTPEVARKLAADVRAAGKRFELVIYPGCDHAFFNDSRPDVYQREAAEDAWRKSLDFLRAHTS